MTNKRKTSNKYKYVKYKDCKDGVRRWYACLRGKGRGNSWAAKSERDAALKIDKKLIEMGKEPVNILVRK
jgi:hypothetical protein